MKNTFHENVSTVEAIAPQSIASTTITSTTIDMLGYEGACLVVLTPAAIAGTNIIGLLQEGDLSNGSDAANITGATKTVVTGGGQDGKSFRVSDCREIRKRYLTVKVTSTGGTNICAALVERFPAGTYPQVAEAAADTVVVD
jgi:hypothetical protein